MSNENLIPDFNPNEVIPDNYDLNEDEENVDNNVSNGIVIMEGVNDLPEFANREARKVHDENLVNENEIDKVSNEIYDLKDRVKVMSEHFKNVQQEVDHTNSLQGAKKAEIATELHLKELTSRGLGKAQLDSKKIQSEIEFVQDQLNTVQGQIYKANEKMDEFKMQMNWNQEELEQWAVAAKQKEDDFLAIEKYKRADEFRIKELNLSLLRLRNEYLATKKTLDDETSDTQAKQMELDRIALEFKNAHIDRQDMINRWQETIGEMNKRDKDINDLGERFSIAKSERAKKEILYNQQRKKLEAQQGENKEVEVRSETLSRIVLKKREDMMIGSNRLVEFRGELESLKNELTTSAENLVAKRAQNTYNTQLLEEKRVQLERERQKYQLTKTKIETAKTNAHKAELTAKQAEDELIQREKDFAAELLRIKNLKEKAIKENQYVFDLKLEDTRLKSEITGAKSISRNLESQLHHLDKEASRQQELLYNAEFQIQQIERKIARGMGERSDEEKVALKKQIEGLEHQLEDVREKRKMLLSQSRKLQNELVTYRKRKEEYAERFKKLTDLLGEKELENRMFEEELKKETKEMEEISVLNDLARLEVRRLRDLLSAKSDAVFSLENRKQQLLLSMEERKQEITVHRDILRSELKALNEDRHNVTMELRNRQANVEKLKARFDSVARGEDEKHSQAYYIIKAAQKREELQRRGDQLDQDVRKCEREIRALQTTLDHLNARNIAFRESFQKVDVKGDDLEVLKQLEERTKLNKDALFRKKKDLQRLITDVDEDSRRLNQVVQQNDKMVKQKDHLKNAMNQIEDEISSQQTQLDELADRIKKISVKHRKKSLENSGADESTIQNGTLEEKAVRAEVTKDVIQNVLYTLGQLASEFPEVAETLNSKLQEADLRLPAKPPSRTGLRVNIMSN